MLGGYLGAEGGKTVGGNVETDVLGRLFGSDKPQQQADWKTSDGKMFSEHSAEEQAKIMQNLTAADLKNMQSAQKEQQSAAEWEAAKDKLKSSNLHNRDKSREEIDAQIKKDEEARVAAEQAEAKMAPKTGEEVLNQTAEERKDLSESQVKYLEQSNERRGLTKEGLTPAQLEEMNKQRGLAASEKEMMEGIQKVEAFFQSVKDFFSGKVQEAEGGATNLGISTDKSSGQKDHLGFEMPQITTPDFSQMWTNFNISDFLPDIDTSQWLTDLTSGVEIPDFSQMWTDFNISDFLPELNISEWLTESMTSFEMPDLSTLLPDFSSVGLTITESLSTIPTVASEMFGSISTAASEGWATIQTEWSQLPSFFDGLWSGAGDAASTAGSAIAGGINSAIGTIKSAWEGLSSWLSDKISSLSKMASNAVSAVTSFVSGGGIGHNAKGTSSWRGGFTEINEQGGEIIDLPSGARIYYKK